MFYNKKSTAGFTLLEFLAVMVLVAVLAVIAVPIYDSYVKKARFQNVVMAAELYKTQVTACIQSLGTLTGCDANTNGIATTTALASTYVNGATVANGLITVTATAIGGLASETYILTPSYTAGASVVTWVASGTCITKNYCSTGT